MGWNKFLRSICISIHQQFFTNRFWCILFRFFMWFSRFQILICKPQSIWRKLLVLSWLYSEKNMKQIHISYIGPKFTNKLFADLFVLYKSWTWNYHVGSSNQNKNNFKLATLSKYTNHQRINRQFFAYLKKLWIRHIFI